MKGPGQPGRPQRWVLGGGEGGSWDPLEGSPPRTPGPDWDPRGTGGDGVIPAVDGGPSAVLPARLLAQHGMAWHGKAWHGTAQHGMEWCSMARQSTARCSMAQCSTMQHGTAWCRLVGPPLLSPMSPQCTPRNLQLPWEGSTYQFMTPPFQPAPCLSFPYVEAAVTPWHPPVAWPSVGLHPIPWDCGSRGSTVREAGAMGWKRWEVIHVPWRVQPGLGRGI